MGMSQAEIKAKVNGWLDKASTIQVAAMLLAIYDRQTDGEQSSETTDHLNGMGFNGTDAAFGSRMAKWYQSKGFLSPKQDAAARKMLRKYWKQLWLVAEAKKGVAA
jgi:hypothetical protein